MNVRKWTSFGIDFDAPVCLVLETRCALFTDSMDVGGNMKEEVKEVYNCLIVSDVNKS